MDERFVKAEQLLTDELFCEKLKACTCDEDVAKLFNDNGAALTVEDMQEITKQSARLSAEAELDEAELENVAGGAMLRNFKTGLRLLALAVKRQAEIERNRISGKSKSKSR